MRSGFTLPELTIVLALIAATRGRGDGGARLPPERAPGYLSP